MTDLVDIQRDSATDTRHVVILAGGKGSVCGRTPR